MFICAFFLIKPSMFFSDGPKNLGAFHYLICEWVFPPMFFGKEHFVTSQWTAPWISIRSLTRYSARLIGEKNGNDVHVNKSRQSSQVRPIYLFHLSVFLDTSGKNRFFTPFFHEDSNVIIIIPAWFCCCLILLLDFGIASAPSDI